MIWSVLLAIAAALWVLRRLWVLWSIPITDLVRILDIDIPKACRICVDKITSNEVYLHWELPGSDETKVVGYVVYLNEVRVASFNSLESFCCLSNLTPNTKYKLNLVSTNSKGYKAKSDSVFVKTKSKILQDVPKDLLQENPENLFRLLTNSVDATSLHKLANNSTNNDIKTRSRSNTASSATNNAPPLSPKLSDSSGDQPSISQGLGHADSATGAGRSYTNPPLDGTLIDDIEELRYHLELGQEELQTVLNQQEQTFKDFKDQEATLLQELDKLKDRKKLEDSNRSAIKSELKMLEDSKALNEVKTAKIMTLLENKKNSIDKMHTDCTGWEAKLKQFESEKNEIVLNEDSIHKELDEARDKKCAELQRLTQVELPKMDDEIRAQTQLKKQRETAATELVKHLNNLLKHLNSAGCIDIEGNKSLEMLKSIDEDIYLKINTEIELDAKLEASWRAKQHKEVEKCNKTQESLNLAKAENAQLKQTLESLRLQQQQLNTPSSISAVTTTTATTTAASSTTLNDNFLFNSSSQSLSAAFLNHSSSLQSLNSNWNSVTSNPAANANSTANNTTTAMQFNVPDQLHEQDLDLELESPIVDTLLPKDLVSGFNAFIDIPASVPKSPSITGAATAVANNFTQQSNEFGLSPPTSRFSLEKSTSPSTSQYHDIQSLLSNEYVNTKDSVTAPNSNKQLFSSFSPKKLSNVFSFNKKKDEADHSKFFHKNGDTIITDELLQNGLWGTHSREGSINSSEQSNANEKDDKSWLKFHNTANTEGNLDKYRTNETSTTDKSSTSESGGGQFFKKRSIFGFGSSDKSPTKKQSQLLDTDTSAIENGDSDIEDYTPSKAQQQAQHSTPTSTSIFRKKSFRQKSFSSHHESENSNITDDSSMSSKSIKKRLSLFGLKKDNISEINE